LACENVLFLIRVASGAFFAVGTTKVAHNGHGHFLVKKSVESQSLVEWRTDVHCSVHVVRLTVDPRSLSSCHATNHPSNSIRKNLGSTVFLWFKVVTSGAMAELSASKPVLCHNVGNSSTPKYLVRSLAAC